MPALFTNPYLLLTLTSLCWAGNAVAGQLARGNISPQMLVTLRWLLVAVVLVAIYHKDLRQHLPTIRQYRWQLIAMAVIGFTAFNSLFYIASTQTTGVNIGILQGSIPVFVLIGAYFAYGTPVGLRQIIGVIVTFAGVIVVASRGDIDRILALEINPGDAIMLFACLLYSTFTVGLKRKPPLPPLVFMAVLAIIALVTSIPPLMIEMALDLHIYPNLQGWGVTMFVALFPSFLAQIFFIRGVELIGPGRAGIFVNLVPVFAALLSVLILSEAFRIYHAIALFMVLGGILLAEHRTRAKGEGQSAKSIR